MKHNDFPTQIMKSLDEAGIPLPSYQQLNNKIAYLRRTLDMHGDIATSGELEAAINKHTEVPEDEHEPFVKDYKIDILPCGTKARFWISITKKDQRKSK